MRWLRNVRLPEEIRELVHATAEALDSANGNEHALTAHIATLQRALRRLPVGHPERGIFLAVLGQALSYRFQLRRSPADLLSALAVLRQAVALVPADDPQRGKVLTELAVSHLTCFTDLSHDPADLDAAIEAAEQALPSATPYLLTQLAIAHAQASAFGDALEHRDAQIRHAEDALRLTDNADVGFAVVLELAAGGYEKRYESQADPTDLDAAIAIRTSAATHLTGDGRMRNMSNLSLDHLDRHRAAGAAADLDHAFTCATEALSECGAEHHHHAELLYKLGMVHEERFNFTGNLAELDCHVELTRAAYRHAPASYVTIALVNLAAALGAWYERTGNPQYLDESIDLTAKALVHPDLEPRQRAICTANLALSHRRRFDYFGARADLDQALVFAQQTVRMLPQDDPEMPQSLALVADIYRVGFARSGDAGDVDTAISLFQRALALPGISEASRQQIEASLAGAYLDRFQREGDRSTLDACIEVGERALANLDDTDRRWASAADVVAGALLQRHATVDGRPTDLAQAVTLAERVMVATRADSRFFLGRLQNLAIAYRHAGPGRVDPAEAVPRLMSLVSKAVDSTPTAQASVRTTIGYLALDAGLLADAAKLFREAVELMPQCAPQGMSWLDQEYRLSGAGSLVSDALGVHLAIGDVVGAVELAELGRGVLLSHRLDVRTDLNALASTEPALAARFEALVAELNIQAHNDTSVIQVDSSRPQELADRWESLLDQIRAVSGFGDFLARPRLTELQEAALGGPIILVTVGALGGDAVVLTSDSVTRIPLPRLTIADAEAHASTLAGVELYEENSIRRARITYAQGASEGLLAWLWEAVTEPILDVVAPGASPGTVLPRVWWVATGLLSMLPLHAAGLPGGPSALDRVISSYTPTIRALGLARQHAADTSGTRLAIAMPRTDGWADLPAAVDEVAYIRNRYPEVKTLTGRDATAEAVLKALPDAAWVHFSCHAMSHPVTASLSGLRLHDRMLRVPEIGRALSKGGELAYLSACATGQGSLFQAEEAIHLASAFQLAGYRHVVATQWPVNDEVAPMAARRFYRRLGSSATADDAAAALHDVTLRLRARFPANPELWAPFIHSGP